MRNQIFIALIGVALATGCHSRETAITKTSTTEYQTVSEGSAQGAAASIGAPGEAPPLVSTAPLSNTNIDTTTSLTITNAQPLPPNTGVVPLGTPAAAGGYPMGTNPVLTGQAPRPRASRPSISITRSPATRTLSETDIPSPTRDASTQTLSPSNTNPPAAETTNRSTDSNPPPEEEQPETSTATAT